MQNNFGTLLIAKRFVTQYCKIIDIHEVLQGIHCHPGAQCLNHTAPCRNPLLIGANNGVIPNTQPANVFFLADPDCRMSPMTGNQRIR